MQKFATKKHCFCLLFIMFSNLRCSRGIKEHQDDDICASASGPQLEIVLNAASLTNSSGADAAADIQNDNADDIATHKVNTAVNTIIKGQL